MTAITHQQLLDLSEQWARAFRAQSCQQGHTTHEADIARKQADAIEAFTQAVIQTTVEVERASRS